MKGTSTLNLEVEPSKGWLAPVDCVPTGECPIFPCPLVPPADVPTMFILRVSPALKCVLGIVNFIVAMDAFQVDDRVPP